jgi:NADH:ubiquinone oxidoreductase subunit F (NADH-binding)
MQCASDSLKKVPQRNIARSAPKNRPGQNYFAFWRCVKPGLYEVPFGATLREVLEMAGGVAGKERI